MFTKRTFNFVNSDKLCRKKVNPYGVKPDFNQDSVAVT